MARIGDLEVGDPADESVVQSLEAALGSSLPPSYRSFLSEFGWLGLGAGFVSGVIDSSDYHSSRGTVLSDTHLLREDFGAPEHLLVIYLHEDGAHCLDLSQRAPDGEAPVVNFEQGSATEVAPTFRRWLEDFVLADG